MCTVIEILEAISYFRTFCAQHGLKTEIIIPSRKQRNFQQEKRVTIAPPCILEKIQ